MQFRLENTPATEKKRMSAFFVLWKFYLFYFNDTAVFLKVPFGHIGHMGLVLKLLCRAELTLNRKSSKLFADTTVHVGHVIRSGHLKRAEHTTDAVVNLEQSTTKTKLRSLLKMCILFRKFVPNVSCFDAVLNKKLRKDQLKKVSFLNQNNSFMVASFTWALRSPPVLSLTRSFGLYIVDSDACDKQMECVLLDK